MPDPPPLSTRGQWTFSVDYDRGKIAVSDAQFVCHERARTTARRMGRFAFELWLGRELIERVRFDFPLLAAEQPRTEERRGMREAPSFAPGARVSTTLSVPASERANRAQLLDRATGDVVEVPWPPSIPAPADAARCAPSPPKAATPAQAPGR